MATLKQEYEDWLDAVRAHLVVDGGYTSVEAKELMGRYSQILVRDWNGGNPSDAAACKVMEFDVFGQEQA